jgi:hypothetical protein
MPIVAGAIAREQAANMVGGGVEDFVFCAAHVASLASLEFRLQAGMPAKAGTPTKKAPR